MDKVTQLYKKAKEAIQELEAAVGDDKSKRKLVIASKVKLYRTVHKLTQDELAKKLGVTKMEVLRWENAKNMPSNMALEKLGTAGIKDDWNIPNSNADYAYRDNESNSVTLIELKKCGFLDNNSKPKKWFVLLMKDEGIDINENTAPEKIVERLKEPDVHNRISRHFPALVSK